MTAQYTGTANPIAGVVTIKTAYSPGDPTTASGVDNHVPPLMRRLSDFIFLIYQYASLQHNQKLDNLEWVIHGKVTNPVCIVVAKTVYTWTQDATLPPWPGKSFTTDTDQGKALLGCPNGYGNGFLLAQHTDQLGSKTVDKVIIFKDDNSQFSMAFHVDDLDAVGSPEREGSINDPGRR
ncbi:hypothetical protein MMC10_009491 [Thelotrema lepadinum]|nr:hypothetical protein [Thelotrema lepadinum]